VSFRLTQLASLDGLRGIAILAVMLHNARYLPGGFLGVDIFFVLSGFLISVLLLQERQRTGTIRLGAFCARRALRLLPALFALLAVVLLAPGLFYLAAPPWKDVAIAALYATNWVNAFAVASLCFYLIERPFLRIKRRFGGVGAAASPSAPEAVRPDPVSIPERIRPGVS